ncbi:hypothetical protein B5M09_004272 [Aphanomyces astaci]|uniref:Strawberry notch AAA domain-containing protein n=1 Tax=Aphanomyces astaci TaxID=112090 RepID=A0A3R8DBC0_APHAT|nr:hypothetical protein B5M09_004272 [Aphanomyces astaci]
MMEVSPGKTQLGSDSINAAKKDHEATAEDDEMTHTEDLVFSPYVCQVGMTFRFIVPRSFSSRRQRSPSSSANPIPEPFLKQDGTGVGKGRQLAGIVLENLCRGRKKHLW